MDGWTDGTCVLLLPSLGSSYMIWCGGESVAMRRACAQASKQQHHNRGIASFLIASLSPHFQD